MANWLDLLLGAPDEDKKAKKSLDQVTEAYDGIEAPEFENIAFDEYGYGGDFDPSLLTAPGTYNPSMSATSFMDQPQSIDARMANAEQAGPSAMAGIGADPRLQQAQMDALSALQGIHQSSGMTAADTANLNRVQSDVATADRGRREAIMSNMAARGQSGSGMELLAQLQSSQAATDRANQAGLDIAGMAQQRALDALMSGGNMAGAMRSQDFGEQSQIASAKDAIEKFNAANKQQANQFNSGAANAMSQFNANQRQDASRFNAAASNDTNRFNTSAANDARRFNIGNEMDVARHNNSLTNSAGMRNLDARQNITNANVDSRNKSRMYNNEGRTAAFNSKMALANGRAGAAGAGLDYWNKAGDRKAQMKGNVLGAGVKVGTTLLSDVRAKKDVERISDAELKEFLEAVQPKKFKYKNPGTPGQPEGDRVGFIAQDVADTNLGKKIINKDENGTMSFDPDNIQGVMLAALAKMMKEDK